MQDLQSSEASGEVSFSGGADDDSGDGESDHASCTGPQPCF